MRIGLQRLRLDGSGLLASCQVRTAERRAWGVDVGSGIRRRTGGRAKAAVRKGRLTAACAPESIRELAHDEAPSLDDSEQWDSLRPFKHVVGVKADAAECGLSRLAGADGPAQLAPTNRRPYVQGRHCTRGDPLDHSSRTSIGHARHLDRPRHHCHFPALVDGMMCLPLGSSVSE